MSSIQSAELPTIAALVAIVGSEDIILSGTNADRELSRKQLQEAIERLIDERVEAALQRRESVIEKK